MYEYPFGNGQQLNLDWFLAEWKNLLAAWDAEKNGIEGALQAEIDRAEAALADVFAARDAAAQSATAAGNSADAAAQNATDASGYLATVRADANTASNAAQNAAQSESNAAESAQTALASKNAAGQSERNAAQSEANANSSKNAAAQSASDADASKSAAAQSAADADASKSAAAQSAEDAENAANSVEASAQQIATNTSDINNLKESIINNSDFNILNYGNGSLALNSPFAGLKVINYSFEGDYNGNISTSFLLSGKPNTTPTFEVTAQLSDDYFSVPLIARKQYTLVCSVIAAEAGTGFVINSVYFADKQTRTLKTISTNFNNRANGEITLYNFTVDYTDVYCIRILLSKRGQIKAKFAIYPEDNIYQRLSAVTALSLSN